MSFHLSTLCTGLALSLAACTFVPATPAAVSVDDGIHIDCDTGLCGPHLPPPPPPPSSPAPVPPVV